MTVAALVLAIAALVADAVLAWVMFRHRRVAFSLSIEPTDTQEDEPCSE